MQDRIMPEKLYDWFAGASLSDLEAMLAAAEKREEKLLWRTLVNLKLQLTQETIVGEALL